MPPSTFATWSMTSSERSPGIPPISASPRCPAPLLLSRMSHADRVAAAAQRQDQLRRPADARWTRAWSRRMEPHPARGGRHRRRGDPLAWGRRAIPQRYGPPAPVGHRSCWKTLPAISSSCFSPLHSAPAPGEHEDFRGARGRTRRPAVICRDEAAAEAILAERTPSSPRRTLTRS